MTITDARVVAVGDVMERACMSHEMLGFTHESAADKRHLDPLIRFYTTTTLHARCVANGRIYTARAGDATRIMKALRERIPTSVSYR